MEKMTLNFGENLNNIKKKIEKMREDILKYNQYYYTNKGAKRVRGAISSI